MSNPENTINELEAKLRITLPQKYKEWLKSDGPLTEQFIGTDAQFEKLDRLMEWSKELLKENNSKFIFPENSFVFAMHQGYQFMYFICDGTDDPEVWYYEQIGGRASGILPASSMESDVEITDEDIQAE